MRKPLLEASEPFSEPVTTPHRRRPPLRPLLIHTLQARDGRTYKVIGTLIGDHGVTAEALKAERWLALRRPLFILKKGRRLTL